MADGFIYVKPRDGRLVRDYRTNLPVPPDGAWVPLGDPQFTASLNFGDLVLAQPSRDVEAAPPAGGTSTGATGGASTGATGGTSTGAAGGTSTGATGDDPRIVGASQKAANLSDLTNAAAARSNLGLAAVASTGAYADLLGTPAPYVLPAATPGALGGIRLGMGVASAGGVLNITYGQAAGTAAAGNDNRITGALQASTNLSDLANAAAARSNLGLAAVAASGAYADLSGRPPAPPTAATAAPPAIGVASPGTSAAYARADHSHASDPAAAGLGGRTVANQAQVAMQAADYVLRVKNANALATAVALPANPTPYAAYSLKDAGRNAGSGHLTVSDPNGRVIDGAATLVIDTDGGAETLRFSPDDNEWSAY